MRLTPRGGLLFAPAGFLGGERWDAYREAVRALRRVDRPTKGHGTRDVAVAAAAVASLQAAGFEVRAEPKALEALRRGADALRALAGDVGRGLDGARARLATLNRAPRGSYQERGIEFLCSRERALLLDDMGTGKTMMALSAAGGLSTLPRVLVVAPASVVGGWLGEARAWLGAGTAATRIASGADFRWPAEGEVAALSYDALARAHALGLLVGTPPGVVLVLDEAHSCKNPKAQRTKAAKAARRAAVAAGGRAWGLTGTPLQNTPTELWTLLCVLGLEGEAFGSWPRYCDAWGGSGAVHLSTAEPTPSVADGLARVAIRRTQEEVLPDLPPLRLEVRWVPVEGRAAELAAEAERLVRERAASEHEEAIAAAIETSSELGEISTAREALALAVLASSEFRAEVERAEAESEPLVAATSHVEPTRALGSRAGWARIAGDVPAVERTTILTDFQAGRLAGLAASIRACGEGVQLTRSSRMLILDLDWNPARNRQMVKRIHRIGQARPCEVIAFAPDCWIGRRVVEACGLKEAQADGALAPLAGREHAPAAVPDLDAVRVLALPRQAQQEAPGAADARPAGDAWLEVDDALRGRLERLAAAGRPLGRWLLGLLADHGRIPGRCAPRGQPKRPVLDLVAEAEVST